MGGEGATASGIRDRRPRERKGARRLATLGIVAFSALSVFAIVAGTRAVDDLRILPHPSSKAELRQGVVRGLARLEAIAPNRIPACTAGYKNGKNTSWIHLNGDERVRFDDGRVLVIPDAATVELFDNTYPQGAGLVPADLERVRARLALVRPGVKEWKTIRCIGPDEDVWVEGCMQGEELRGCASNDGHVLLTPGGPALRAQWLMSHAHGFVALALVGVVAALRIAWGVVVQGRSVVSGLAAQEGVASNGLGSTAIATVGGLAAAISAASWGTAYGPWFLCAAVAVVALTMIQALVVRLRVLSAARRVLVGTETSRLHGAGSERNELAVRIARDATPVDGFRAGEKHALVCFEIYEEYTRKSGNKTVTSTKLLHVGVHPRFVPIEDASGRGVLDLDRCEVDVPAEPAARWQRSAETPAWVVARFGPLPESPTHRMFAAKWRVVDVGDPLLVYGEVERVAASAVGAPEIAAYRTSPEVPVVRAREDRTSIAHVGTEAALVRGITRERRVAAAALLATLASSTGAIWAFTMILRG